MNSVIIAYDRNRGDDYKPLIDELERLGAERLQFSLWKLDGTVWQPGHTLKIIMGQSCYTL